MSFSTTQTPVSSPQPDPAAAHSERLVLLHRARWNLAVLEELAKPGHMALAPVFDDAGQVIDFTWREASPTATLALGCAGEDLVGRRLKQVLVECAIDASVFVNYQTVFLQQQTLVLEVESKNGATFHNISPHPARLTVEITCAAATDRAAAAQREARALE
jgi:hypothetical protein